jgi:hypothetical protein
MSIRLMLILLNDPVTLGNWEQNICSDCLKQMIMMGYKSH